MPTTVTVLPTGTYGPVTAMVLGPVSVPTGLTGVIVTIDRTSLLSTTLAITWDIELSLDGGTTWSLIAGAGTQGGPTQSFKKLSGPPISSLQMGLDDPTNPTRQVRATLTITEAAHTQVSVTLLP